MLIDIYVPFLACVILLCAVLILKAHDAVRCARIQGIGRYIVTVWMAWHVFRAIVNGVACTFKFIIDAFIGLSCYIAVFIAGPFPDIVAAALLKGHPLRTVIVVFAVNAMVILAPAVLI
jgi:hypothetical protein